MIMENDKGKRYEVFWGRVTADEIKKIQAFEETSQVKVHRRATISHSQTSSSSYTFDSPTSIEESYEINATGESQYFTPNVTFQKTAHASEGSHEEDANYTLAPILISSDDEVEDDICVISDGECTFDEKAIKEESAESNLTINDLSSNSVNDELSSANSSLRFNDTLEEMEMALKDGLDYVMPDEPILSPKITHTNPPQIKSIKTMIPLRVANMNTPCKDFEFKKPSKIVLRSKTPDYKHVLSPVAFYIKNSVKVPQVQHVAHKPLLMSPSFNKSKCVRSLINNENKEGMLPARLYKPAKRTLTSKPSEIRMPTCIQRHLPVMPDIIKHQGRLGNRTEELLEEKFLLNEDLTVNCSDIDISNLSLQDVSMLTTKKAYIK